MSEQTVIRSAVDVIGAIRQMTHHPLVPGATWHLREGAGRDPDLILEVDGKVHVFEVKARTAVTGRDIDRMAAPESSILATVRLTDSVIKHCVQRGLSAIGLNGRVWLRRPGLVIDTRLPETGARFRMPDPEINPFSPRSSRLGRALLSSGDRKWTLTQLAHATDLSLSRVSEVLGVFTTEGWVTGARGNWQLAEPDALLDAWAKADRWQDRGSIKEYTSLEPTLDAVAGRLLATGQVDIAFTQWFAANLRYPYTTTPICSAYRRRHLSPDEATAAGLKEVSVGGKLWVIAPRDEGIFQFTQTVNGHSIVCDAQIYIDLLQVGLRGPDQARALREWQGFRR